MERSFLSTGVSRPIEVLLFVGSVDCRATSHAVTHRRVLGRVMVVFVSTGMRNSVATTKNIRTPSGRRLFSLPIYSSTYCLRLLGPALPMPLPLSISNVSRAINMLIPSLPPFGAERTRTLLT